MSGSRIEFDHEDLFQFNGDENIEFLPISLDYSFPKFGLFSVPKPIINMPQSTFRGDLRGTDEIFKKGFFARGLNPDLCLHADPANGCYFPDSAHVATSPFENVAKLFPMDLPPGTKQTYLYEINTKRPSINVAQELAPRAAKGEILLEDYFVMSLGETERTFLHKIESSEIKGARVVDATTRTIQEGYIPNPNYIPPSLPELTLWKAGRLAGAGLAAFGAVQDSLSFYNEYKISENSGDYSNTYNEGLRIAGGWSGAWAAGATAAELSVAACIPLTPFITPLGPPVCGFLGGLVGSMLAAK